MSSIVFVSIATRPLISLYLIPLAWHRMMMSSNSFWFDACTGATGKAGVIQEINRQNKKVHFTPASNQDKIHR
jgi:hypothetical protein